MRIEKRASPSSPIRNEMDKGSKYRCKKSCHNLTDLLRIKRSADSGGDESFIKHEEECHVNKAHSPVSGLHMTE